MHFVYFDICYTVVTNTENSAEIVASFSWITYHTDSSQIALVLFQWLNAVITVIVKCARTFE